MKVYNTWHGEGEENDHWQTTDIPPSAFAELPSTSRSKFINKDSGN